MADKPIQIDYEAGSPRGVRNSLVWLILLLCVVAYCGLGNWSSRSATTRPSETQPSGSGVVVNAWARNR